MTAWSWAQVTSRRLGQSHLLALAATSDVVEVVRGACGMKAQVSSATELCVGVRTEGD
jgi:hypothetical protein